MDAYYWHATYSMHLSQNLSHPNNTSLPLTFSGEYSSGVNGNKYPVESDFLLKM
jgi:hypothetical protein